jgi:hypothetical protein
MDRSRLGEPVNTATGPQGARPPAAGRQVMGTGAAITVIAVGAILWFALPAGSPRSLNVHVVGVVLILAGVLGVARVQGDDRFFAQDAPGREEDDL